VAGGAADRIAAGRSASAGRDAARTNNSIIAVIRLFNIIPPGIRVVAHQPFSVCFFWVVYEIVKLIMEVFERRIRTEQTIMRLLLLICFCSILLSMLLFFRKIVRKVKDINRLLNEENYYNLGSIEEGIQTLLATHHASKNRDLIFARSSFIRNFIRGDFLSREEAMAAAGEVGMEINRQKWVLVLLRSNSMSQESTAYRRILNSVGENEQLEGYGIHMVNNNQNLFVLFADEKETLWKAVRTFQEIMKQYSPDFILAVSDLHTDFTEGASAYLEVETAFDTRMLLDNSQIIFFTELERNEFINPISESDLKQLKYSIRMKDEAGMEKMVRSICDAVKTEKVSLYTFKVFYNNLINMLLMEWKEEKLAPEKLFNVFSVSQCMNKNDFYNLICDMCRTIIRQLEEKSTDSSDILQKAIAYMEKNYMDISMSINTVAEYLGISATRIGIEFKNQLDVKPLDYLTNLRMEEARRLLLDSGLSVQDISRRVGYEDVHVFIRWFKKYVGTTPGRYREMHKG